MTENEEYANLKDWSLIELRLERKNLNNIIKDAIVDFIEISVEIGFRKKVSK